MARIRSVKPELRTDLTVAAWPIPARYAWVLLLGYLDDRGRGHDDDRLLVADLFPLDRDVTERKIAAWKRLWVDGGQVCRYEAEGTAYLHAIKWSAHQKINRPTRSRIPPCPTHGGEDDRLTPDDTADSVSPSVNGSVSGSPQTPATAVSDSLPRAQACAPADLGSKGTRDLGFEGSREVEVPTQPTPTSTHDLEEWPA